MPTTIRRNLPGLLLFAGLLALVWFATRRGSNTVSVTDLDPEGPAELANLDIVTLLPRDGIPAIDNPQFYSATEADTEYAPDELVLGVSIDGDHRAYSTGLLSGHEIVNDTVGGRPIAVTW